MLTGIRLGENILDYRVYISLEHSYELSVDDGFIKFYSH